jgi:TolB protein
VDRNAAYLPDRLSKNLAMTGLFNSLDQRASLEPESLRRAGLDAGSQPDFPSWSNIGADFLVKGAMGLSGSRLTLELRLFDVGPGRQLLGKRYTGPAKEGRKMINQFTNDVLEAITGLPGVFGSEIIFSSGPPSAKEIMLTELGSDEAVRLAGHRGGPSTQPTLGPGGRKAWVRRNNKAWELVLDGRVISSGDAHMSPGFRPDGTVAAAVSGPQTTDIYAFSGRNKTRLTSAGGINVSPSFSPDGSRMAYASDQGGVVSIYVAPAGGGPGQPLVTGGKATDPAWSPTGEYIAFVSRETDICIIRPDGRGLKQLTGGQGFNQRPSFSPDGRMIVFSSTRNGKSQLFVMAANGDSQQPLMPDYGPPQEQPFWSPVRPPASY